MGSNVLEIKIYMVGGVIVKAILMEYDVRSRTLPGHVLYYIRTNIHLTVWCTK